MEQQFPEAVELARLVAEAGALVRTRTLTTVPVPGGPDLPVMALELGPERPDLPVFVVTAGVHGLEGIGTRVALSWVRSLVEGLRWDRSTRARLERCRVHCLPIVNPGGMSLQRRSNPRGVDLMRNAPVDSSERVPFLLGGHRITPRLPWYRGVAGTMEREAVALVDFVDAAIRSAPVALSLDLHSGFGLGDRLWYPWAKASSGFPRAAEAQRFEALLTRTFPHHVYRVEPQSESYMTHGDLWDLLFARQHERGGGVFVPWTLEMGSWLWVRKNPRQLLTRPGPFNPVLPHRIQRVLRRHLLLLDLFWRAVDNPEAWRDGG